MTKSMIQLVRLHATSARIGGSTLDLSLLGCYSVSRGHMLINTAFRCISMIVVRCRVLKGEQWLESNVDYTELVWLISDGPTYKSPSA